MIKYTELFYSVQGEGAYTGQASVFLRLWGCNLQCHGFGQKNPLDPDTWVLDFKDFQPKSKSITSIDQLPVWKHGCDSSYTWAKQYNYLAKHDSADTVVDRIMELLPNNKWGSVHFVITGGEPLMHQPQIVELLECMKRRQEEPKSITIETNGTQPLQRVLTDYLWDNRTVLNFSVSPKLQNVTGEKNCKTIKPEYVSRYPYFGKVWLKPVVTDTEQCWEEVDRVVGEFRNYSSLTDVPVYVMPCGATEEEQEKDGYMKSIAIKALERGWNFSIRAHVFIFGNTPMT